jgi:festuclavine dehydrogenase
MAILITGGTGKTSSRVASLAKDNKVPFLIASRKGEDGTPAGLPAVKFDWLDSSTFETPFQYKFVNGEKINAVYLVLPPEAEEPKDFMNPFIDIAVKKYNVKKFVLLAGSSITNGGHYIGQVWKHLSDLGVDHTVLLATWFMG